MISREDNLNDSNGCINTEEDIQLVSSLMKNINDQNFNSKSPSINRKQNDNKGINNLANKHSPLKFNIKEKIIN